MAFDVNAFEQAKVTFPTKKIPVPELKEFFDKGEKPVWEVKGVTGNELGIVNEAAELLRKEAALLEGLESDKAKKLKENVQKILKKNPDAMSEDVARRLKLLEFGTKHDFPEHLCVKLAHAKPMTFNRLTNEIITMTGDGADLGK